MAPRRPAYMDDAGATMGLGFETALGMLDFAATTREATLARM